MSIVLQFYPNGEFTQGVDTVHRRKSRPERISDEMTQNLSPYLQSELIAEMNAEMYNADIEKGSEYISALGSEWVYLCKYHDTYYYAVDNHIDEPWVLESPHSPSRLVGMGEITPSGLVHQTVEFSQNPKPSRKKCLKMSSGMARNIRNACYLLEQQHGKDNLSFLTLTLPDLSAEGLAMCAANWGRMVDQFLKWLRTKTEKQGIPLEYVYCTEIQTKRKERTGNEALHIHLLFRGKRGKRGTWVVTPKQVRAEWVRCIKSVCNEPFETRALENLQRIRKSAGGYMSKYLSKRKDGYNPESDESTGIRFVGHWGGMSRQLSKSIKRRIIRLDSGSSAGEVVLHTTRGLRGGHCSRLLAYYREGFICTNGGENGSLPLGLRVAVGCLAKTIDQGGLTDLLEYVIANHHQWEC